MELSEKDRKKRFEEIKASLYYQRISQPYEKVESYKNDHCYDTPCNWWGVKALAKPLKFIFGTYENPEEAHPTQLIFDAEEYRKNMTSRKMNETLAYIQGSEGDSEDDDPLNDQEREIWAKATDYLNPYKLARIAHHGHKNELIWRKLVVEKAGKRFRSLFLQHVENNVALIQWLHNKLLDELDEYFLQVYIEICQYLRGKIPGTMNLVLSSVTSQRIDVSKAFSSKPWDPISPQLLLRSLKSLADNPNFLLIPGRLSSDRLIRRWERHLSCLGMISIVNQCNIPGATLAKNLDKSLAAVKGKVRQIKEQHPGKRLILFGFNSGSALACQAARSDKVSAVVCLGFPQRTIEGCRDLQGRDVLVNLPSPILFVVGEKAMTSNVEEMDKLRGRIRIGNCLIVVNGADDQLRMSNSTLMKEGVTQIVVDRCVVEEVAEFLEVINLFPHNFVRGSKNKTATDRTDVNGAAVVGETDGSPSETDSRTTSETDESPASDLDQPRESDQLSKLSAQGCRSANRPRIKTRGGGARGGCRGGRRGRKKKSDLPPPSEPMDSTMDGVFKRPRVPHKTADAGPSQGSRDAVEGAEGDKRVKREITDCDRYIDNLIEIMRLEDELKNVAHDTKEEDEEVLAQFLNLDPHFV